MTLADYLLAYSPKLGSIEETILCMLSAGWHKTLKISIEFIVFHGNIFFRSKLIFDFSLNALLKK